MIKLYSFSPAMGVPCPSPFPIKLQLFMQLAGIPYEVIIENNPGKGPKGKIPFIDDNGTLVADSHLIIRHLMEHYIAKGKGQDPDAGLSPEQKGLTTAVQKMCDEHLYWGIVYGRWVDERFKSLTRDVLFADIPKFIRAVVFKIASKGMVKAMHGHGIGRHAQDDIYAMIMEDIDALDALLGNKDYFLGDSPHSIDAIAFPYIVNLINSPQALEICEHARGKANLQAYNQRILKGYFPEFAQ